MLATRFRFISLALLLAALQLACATSGGSLTPTPGVTALTGRWQCPASTPQCMPERLSIGDNDWFPEREGVEFYEDGTVSTNASHRCAYAVQDDTTFIVDCRFGFGTYSYAIAGDTLTLGLHIATVELHRAP